MPAIKKALLEDRKAPRFQFWEMSLNSPMVFPKTKASSVGLSLDKWRVITRFGKIGTSGASTVKSFPHKAAAVRFFEKMKKTKIHKRGYSLVSETNLTENPQKTLMDVVSKFKSIIK